MFYNITLTENSQVTHIQFAYFVSKSYCYVVQHALGVLLYLSLVCGATFLRIWQDFPVLVYETIGFILNKQTQELRYK